MVYSTFKSPGNAKDDPPTSPSIWKRQSCSPPQIQRPLDKEWDLCFGPSLPSKDPANKNTRQLRWYKRIGSQDKRTECQTIVNQGKRTTDCSLASRMNIFPKTSFKYYLGLPATSAVRVPHFQFITTAPSSRRVRSCHLITDLCSYLDEAAITEFILPVITNQNVVWLEVTMDDTRSMQSFQDAQHFYCVEHAQRFLHPLARC